MHRRAIVLGGLAMLAACSRQEAKAPDAPAAPEAPAVAAARAAPDPAATIRPLYGAYLGEGAFADFEHEAPWSADLWSKIEAMMARSRARNEPILDFDPLIGAQDGQLSALRVDAEAVVPGSHAVVRARFVNLGRESEIVYDLIWERQAWRVDNIRGGDWNLREIVML